MNVDAETDRPRWEWQTLLLIGACYLFWLISTASFGYVNANYGMAGGVAMLFGITALSAAFHTSLQHEAVHGHPTPYGWLNEALVFPSLILVYPFRRYRELHLKHHVDEHLTDPYDDPESYYWPQCEQHDIRPLMRKLLEANNTFFGRMALGAPLGLFGFYRTEILRLKRDEPGVRRAWIYHLAGCGPVILWIIMAGIPFWLYLLVVVYPGVSWILVRSFAEHQAAQSVGGRTAIVETSGFFSLLFLNNNLHIVHHAHPTVAWYDLPRLYRERKQNYLIANGGYLFEGYWQIASRFAFRKKQPVIHPILRRSKEVSLRSKPSSDEGRQE
ncbi:MAG: fatty acid desaturase [Rhizobiaceae bacterium]|nr:fatty acid desaturase [Rhizobiaceae bacterium]